MSLGVIYLNTSCDPNFVTVITTPPILEKNNIGVIVGSVIGSLCFFFLIVVFTILIIRKSRKQKK